MTIGIHKLLKAMVERGASDLHITVGSPPLLRIDGSLVRLKMAPLTADETKALCYSVLTETQKQRFEASNECDLSFGVKNLSRFRANVFMQRGTVAAAFRLIPFKFFSFDELGLPPVVTELANRPRGLILVTGPTGSGKSTTLASIIDYINQERRAHIITIEDPIEFLHPHKNCIVNQREINGDTESFKNALKYVLRQDPDVVLIGEMRDLETVEAAMSLAETGHMTLATLHTNTTVQTINRVIDFFPPHQQNQVRVQLSFVLEGILCQQLVPKSSGFGRLMALEVLVPTPALRNLIRDNKIQQMYSAMQVGQERYGMQTLNQALFKLYKHRQITMEDCIARCTDVEEMRGMLSKEGLV